MIITGKRHDFVADFDVGFDERGRILALTVMLASRCGYSADLSAAVNGRALTHLDNAYFLEHGSRLASLQDAHRFQYGLPRLRRARRRWSSSNRSSMRLPARLPLDPLDVRRANFYGIGERDTTYYGQKVEDNVIHDIADRLEAHQQLPPAPSASRGVERRQPDHQARPCADASQVRHLVHGDTVQPGRRAGERVRRRHRAAEPWRNRRWGRASHQGGAGRRLRAGRAALRDSHHIDGYLEGSEHLGDCRIVGLGPQ